MPALAQRARLALLGGVTRLVTGRGLSEADRERLAGELALHGFRNAARGHLLRRLLGGSDPGALTLVVPALDGLFRIAVSAGDLGVGRDLARHGVYEPHVVALYARVLRPGMTVLDVGANVGFHALHAAVRVGPSGRVFAIEPDPGNAALLRHSLAVGALGGPPLPVTLIEAALSDQEGALVLSDLGNAGNSGARFTHRERSVLERSIHGPRPAFHEVEAVRWDSSHAGVRLDFVKIDVEGHEPLALRGMEEALRAHRPLVLSEIAPSNLSAFGGVEAAAYLAGWRERGYDAALLLEPSGEARPASDAAILAEAARRHHVDVLFSPRPELD
jgi:FkbM family methyltransferase